MWHSREELQLHVYFSRAQPLTEQYKRERIYKANLFCGLSAERANGAAEQQLVSALIISSRRQNDSRQRRRAIITAQHIRTITTEALALCSLHNVIIYIDVPPTYCPNEPLH